MTQWHSYDYYPRTDTMLENTLSQLQSNWITRCFPIMISLSFFIVFGCNTKPTSKGELFRLGENEEAVMSLQFCPNGKNLISIHYKSELLLWDLSKKTVCKRVLLPNHGTPVISHSAARLIVACWEETAFFFAIDNNLTKTGEIPMPRTPLEPALNPNGQYLACGGINSSKISVSDVRNGKHLYWIDNKPHYSNRVTWSRDGSTLLVTDSSDTVSIWDSKTRKKIKTLQNKEPSVRSILSLSDEVFLTAGAEGVCVWNIRVGTKKRIFTQHTNRVIISPNRKLLASDTNTGSRDPGTIIIWDAGSLKQVTKFQPHYGKIRAFAFSPDNSMIATGGLGDGTIKIWDLKKLLNHQD